MRDILCYVDGGGESSRMSMKNLLADENGLDVGFENRYK